MLLRLIKTLLARSPRSNTADSLVYEAAKRGAAAESISACESLERGGDPEAALACYRAYVAAHPNSVEARAGIANCLMSLWRMDECIDACAEAHRVAPENTELFSGWLFYSHFATAPDARELLARHRAYGEHLRSSLAPTYRDRYAGTPDPGRRLRVGYVSRNFSRHSVGYFIEPVIEHHARDGFDVYCYHTHRVADDTTTRISQKADGWRHLPDVHPDALAACIAHDAIDVLVDLAGHTELNRLPAFAREPAPLQITWLAYPDTTGIDAIAWRITDATADPPGAADAMHTEKLLRIDAPFLCYRPAADAPPIAARAEAAEVVFGSFNIVAKINEPLIALWCRVLDAVPRSRLVLKSGVFQYPSTTARLLERFSRHGIAAERLELRGWSAERVDHLQSYGDLDIALDTFPYNGTTTTCEALWMGVPVITLAGDRHMARVGATLLEAVGLESLVACTPDEYVDLAVALAADTARRQRLRTQIRERLLASPLLDHAGFTRKLESAYRDAWRAHCAAKTCERTSAS